MLRIVEYKTNVRLGDGPFICLCCLSSNAFYKNQLGRTMNKGMISERLLSESTFLKYELLPLNKFNYLFKQPTK